TLYDPVEDEEIEGVLTGDHYTLKLEHKVDKKHSSRGAGPKYPYQLSGQPAGGSDGGGRAIGIQVLFALLAHGAKENLNEMYTFKGDRSLEHWRAIEKGDPLPPPEMPHSSKKFTAMLRGMGINLEEEDQKVKMAPFLDDHVEQVSNGEIENASALRAKDLQEEDGGLFDFETTGGLEGEQWAHIELAEPMPHPTFQQAIRDVTGLKESELDDLMSGDKGVIGDKVVDDPDKPGAKVGGEAVESMLSNVDVDERLDEIEEKAPDKSGSELNKLHREARVLENFDDLGLDLEDMVTEKIPVIPPKLRPVIELPSGDLSVSDVNEHYRALIMMNNQMEALQDREGLSDELDDARSEVYEGLRGVMGQSMGLVPNDETKGLSQTISGNAPKEGYFHKNLIKRRQDTSGTAVVGPDPELDMDSIGIPEEMAWNVFEPHIKKDLTSQGLTPLKAEDEIDERTQMAQDALERVMDDKNVLANRAPTLHKWSIMAFEPELVPGHQVTLPVEVLGGFNADFDGDSAICQMPILRESGLRRRHIRDFPRKEKIKEEGNVEVYDVPEDVSVYGYDDEQHQIRPYPVKHFSVHHGLDIKEVCYKSGRSVEVSKDHSLYCLDTSRMDLQKTIPSESEGMYTPRPKKMSLPDSKNAIEWGETDSPQGTELVDECPLDAHSGYFWGAMVGDGYASYADDRPNCCYVGFCSTQDSMIEAVRSFIQRVGGKEGSVHESKHEFKGHDCFSKKAHWAFSQLGFKVQELIGTQSSNKHLPPFWIYGDESFRLGLMAGLLDSDGSVSVSNSKNKPEPNVQYATSSEQLAEEFVLLCNSLGVRANITHHDSRDKDEYTVSVSTPDLQPYASELELRHPGKQEALEFLGEYEHRDTSRDVIPIGESLAKQMRRSLGHPRDCSDEHHTAYIQLSNACDKGYITRGAYRRWKERDLLEKMTDVDDEGVFERFLEIAEADNIIWDRVESIEDAGEDRTAYDLTVPDCNVFMASNGLILWDTFGIHVPATEEANQEAEDMKPSNNMYLPGRAQEEMAQELQHEYVLGLYQITRRGDRKSETFDGPEEAIEAAENDEVDWTDLVQVKGIGNTTPGRVRAMQPVPEDLRDYETQLDDDTIHEFLKEIEQEHSKQAYLDTLEDWKHLSRDYAYKSGSSFLLSDLQALNDKRDRLYDKADEKVQDIKRDPSLDEDGKKQKII
ncbi:MAG: LAGLIDADG family homing endonuclease, partial [Bradymonadaceae bacterium]